MSTIHHENLISRSLPAGSTFASHTQHTSAFNTIHIIVAVIGIIGACLVGITIFIVCRKRRRRRRNETTSTKDIEKNNMMKQGSTHSTETLTNNPRFDQFASDFERNNNDIQIEQPKPAVIHIEDTSPMMQQYRLQLKLLQQSAQQQPQQQHHRQNPSDASSSTVKTNSSTVPPPPYRP